MLEKNNEIIAGGAKMIEEMEKERATVKAVSKEFMLDLVHDGLAYSLFTCNDEAIGEYAKTAATICRRRFKPKDVVLMYMLDEDCEGNAGIAFTTEGIFRWDENDHFVFGIRYDEIKKIDYDSNGVKINAPVREVTATRSIFDMGRVSGNGSGNETRIIPCACLDWELDDEEEQEYIREMYNFVADIFDEINS